MLRQLMQEALQEAVGAGSGERTAAGRLGYRAATTAAA